MLDRLRTVAYYGGRVLLFGFFVVFVVMVFASITAADVLPLLTMGAILVSCFGLLVVLAWIAHRLTDAFGWDDE